MDSISALMGPGQAQIALLAKAMDSGKAKAEGVLSAMIPQAQIQAAAAGRVDTYL